LETKIYKGEEGYLDLVQDILSFGTKQDTDRTGVGTLTLFDAKVVYDEGDFNCFSTVRPAALRMAFEEMWFFLRHKTNTKELEAKGIDFWRGNTSREFLDKRGLFAPAYPEGDIGAAYSSQWRNFGDYEEYMGYPTGTDQLQKLLQGLRNDKYSRRHVVSLWNPLEEKFMPLTPCWYASQWVVLPNEDGTDALHLKLLNRSLDSVFGFSFAVQQYRLLQLCLCKMFGFKLGKLSCDLTHAHVYYNQIEFAKELVNRELGKQGEVIINKDLNSMEDLLSLEWEDFTIKNLKVNKKPFEAERPPMNA
jgi:thymidylate synthase